MPPYVVIYLPKDGLLAVDQHCYGPYWSYEHAYDRLCSLPPASECEHKYIQELED